MENKSNRLKKYLKPLYLVPLFVAILLSGYFYTRTYHAVDTFTYSHITMDTVMEIRFQAPGVRAAEEIRDDIFNEVERLEKLFSRSIPDSDVTIVNNNAGQEPVQVSAEVFYVTKKAIEFAELTEGAFDPTIAPLTDLWGFFSEYEYRVPDEKEIETALELVDYALVELISEEKSIYLPVEGMGLELGGIAKGFIVDRALEILKEAGIKNAYVNAGDIGLIGNRFDGKPWRIGVKNPRNERDMIAVLPLVDQSVDTSGDYERAFEKDGIKYHHILDPHTGKPAKELASVTVITGTTMDADVLSTAAFVLGLDDGFKLIEELENAQGIFVTPALNITYTSGLQDIIELEQ